MQDFLRHGLTCGRRMQLLIHLPIHLLTHLLIHLLIRLLIHLLSRVVHSEEVHDPGSSCTLQPRGLHSCQYLARGWCAFAIGRISNSTSSSI